MAAPVAFMVMPYGVKRTGSLEGPTKVDFDALWAKVHQPLLDRLGYAPVRADQDVGALIIVEMVQRLALADLVVADISLANANVYYEIGVRHAAQRQGCVLVTADWARPTFDLAQMRQLRYPLADGKVRAAAARRATAALSAGLAALASGTSPVFEALPGYPGRIDPALRAAFQKVVTTLQDFETDVRRVHHGPRAGRRTMALEVVERYQGRPAVGEVVAQALIVLLRDYVGWDEVLAYIDALPDSVARLPVVVEQQALGLANAGDVAGAAARLEALIDAEGATSERLGLLGGRYKQLWRAATTAAERRRYLDAAIDAYERGMRLDLNDYYPASNLARLYRARGRRDDQQRAAEANVVTVAACRRSLELGIADEWVRPTLLTAAFDAGSVGEARRALTAVEREGPEGWKLETTLRDLELSVENQPDDAVRGALGRLLNRLRRLHAGTLS